MKRIPFFQLIFILFFLTLWGCKTNEKTVPPSSESLMNDYLGIRDFTVKDAIVKSSSPRTNIVTDYLIVLLPEGYSEDFIIPSITLGAEVQSISPKSGEKIDFERKSAVEYTVTKKDGQIVKFKLYVYRQGKINAEVFTKEIKLTSMSNGYVKFRLKNIGTLGNPLGIYGKSNSPIVKVFDLNNKEIFSSRVIPNGNDTITIPISKSDDDFLKKGDFTMSFSMNEDTLLGKNRTSDVFTFKILKVEDIFISPNTYGSLERGWMLNTDYFIKGVKFDTRKKYEIVFENEYLDAPIILNPKVIDENNLLVRLPDNTDTLQCFITLRENENVIAEADGAIILNRKGFTRNCEFSTDYETGYKSFIKKNQPFTFNRGQAFGAYYVINHGGDSNGAHLKGGLKLINLISKKEYNIDGKLIRCVWDCSASYWSFTIDENVPQGLYEVYAINEQINAGRYWRKLEVK